MKLTRLSLAIFILFIFFLISTASAADLNGTDVDQSNDDFALELNDTEDIVSSNGADIYVDSSNGDDSNDARTPQTSVKTFEKALSLSGDDSSIYLAGGNYNGLKNTRITITKSVSIIGSDDTVFDGEDTNFLFIVADNAKVTFRNIKFVNAFKQASHNNPTSIYGGALEIGNATVLIDGCSFIKNTVAYDSSINKYNYGGAISNFGDLTISNSYFDSNIATSTSGLFSYGGAIYNAGNLSIDYTAFNNSRAMDFGYGGAIYNDGVLTVNNSRFSNSESAQETKASVLFNAGNCVLLNSIIENNTIGRANFYYIYGAIYNYGKFTARGNVFRNNSGIYEAPNPEYRGSPTVYSVGELNMTYNVFVDNAPFNGIASDVYVNGGEITTLDDNWWSTNDDPYTRSKVNVAEQINSWFVFNMVPEYTPLDIGQSVDIITFWSLSSSLMPKINLFPVLEVTFKTQFGNVVKNLTNGQATFNFDRTQSKGLYEVTAGMGEFSQTVLVDVGKVISTIKVNVTDNVTYTDDITMSVEVSGNDGNVPTGNVSVFVGKALYTINLENGKGFLNLSKLDPNNYNFKIVYEGNDNYFKAFEYANVSVNKASTNLSIYFPDIMIDQKGTVTVTLGPQGVQGQAYLYINGVRKKVLYLYNGNTTVSVSNFAEGVYNATVEFWGTKYYEASSASTTFMVSKYDTALAINVSDIKIGEDQNIIITVNPSGLRGEAVLSINGVNETIFLDSDVTNVSVSNLGAGIYDVDVFYMENSKYHASNASATFRVFKTFTSLSVDIVEDGFNGTVTVRTNYTDCTGEVGVYVNFRLYLLNLTNGAATFRVTFDKGTNYIYVYYDGDENYEFSDWNTTLGVAEDFILIGGDAEGYHRNDLRYVVRLIEYNGIAMPNRIVNVLFNNIAYNITTNSDGIAYLPLNLDEGIYTISATYKNQTVINNITVKAITFNVTAKDIIYGENETFEVEFERNVTGRANIFIENVLNVTVDINDGKASYDASGINVGSYEVKVKYINDYYESDSTITGFNVGKANPEIDAQINDIVYGENGTVRVTLPFDATGTVTFRIDSNSQSKVLSEGICEITLSGMEKGTHNITISYEGDSNYNATSLKSAFSVKDAYSDIRLYINDVVYGENITVTAILNESATGNVIFNVSDIIKTAEIRNGIANWTFTGINAGDYEIMATYPGDSTFISSRNSTSFKVSKANSTIELNVDEVYLNENILIYALLSPNATGTVSFSIKDYYSPRNKPAYNSAAVWYISPLNTGSYRILATYNGDGNYYPSDADYILNITQRKSVLTVDIADAGINDRVSAKVRLTSSDGEAINGTVTLTIGPKSYDIIVYKGSGNLVIGKIAPANYTYKAVYEGNERFSKSSITGSFKVVDDLLNLKIVAKNVSMFYGKDKSFDISVVDDSNNPVSGAEIIVKIGGTTYTKVSDSSGKISIPISLDVGKHNVVCTFNENARYHSASANASIEILSTVEGVDVTTLYGTSAQYFAIFTDSNGKPLVNQDVKFTVGKNSYTMKTLLNGICKINLNFSPGKYVISATNPVTGQKITNNIFIFLPIMKNKDVTSYYGAGQTYKVEIHDKTGKVVGKGKTVKFKVNGKTYSVKTDKNGYAKCKVNLKPNVYKITATYNGFKVTNRIVVKPVLTASVSVKKAKIIKIKAKLVNKKGKAVKGKKIAVKFKGKTYKIKTNKKGIAKITIKHKMKVGKHKLKIKYGKSTITKTIKIKK